jgi:hypothetical protein
MAHGSGLLSRVPADPRRLTRHVLGLALVAKAGGPEFSGQRVRGVAQGGSDLVISRDSIRHDLRSRPEDLVSIEFHPRPEREIRSALEREAEAECWTRLDVAIRS